MFSSVQRLAPGLSAGDCIAEFAGLRAVAEDEDFHIGPTRVPGFVNVAGIQSPGLTAAPAIAEMVRGILHEEGLPLDPDPDFEPRVDPPVRFAARSRGEQAALAANDPHHARIACRCEQVTEGEISGAIERGARTLDGLKFRTRAGMGRCQGGFCTLRCLELLAKRLEVPLTTLTKRGGRTWLVRARMEEA